MDIKVLDDNPIYKGHTFRLKFTFSNKYPIGNSHTLALAFRTWLTEMEFRTTRGPIH